MSKIREKTKMLLIVSTLVLILVSVIAAFVMLPSALNTVSSTRLDLENDFDDDDSSGGSGSCCCSDAIVVIGSFGAMFVIWRIKKGRDLN